MPPRYLPCFSKLISELFFGAAFLFWTGTQGLQPFFFFLSKWARESHNCVSVSCCFFSGLVKGACIFVSYIYILPFPVRQASSIMLGYRNYDCTISRTYNLEDNFLQHFRLHPVRSENGYMSYGATCSSPLWSDYTVRARKYRCSGNYAGTNAWALSLRSAPLVAFLYLCIFKLIFARVPFTFWAVYLRPHKYSEKKNFFVENLCALSDYIMALRVFKCASNENLWVFNADYLVSQNYQ